ncbi:MAG: PilZ domain-containing protein [Candidatus Omnitrophota bacterium]|nr:PilZ domain-containing protein [Candidatus Omnitrophota bacterium]
MNEEKRSSKRIATKVIVHCRKESDKQYMPDYFVSFTKDLSSEGARIVASREIKPRDKFTASLELPTLFLPVLTFSEAVWVKEPEVGIKFIKVEEADNEKLKSFLELKEADVKTI